MSLTEVLRSAFRSIRANRMRALLTMLGVIVGVASVIALSAVGQSSTNAVTTQVESLGSNLLTVMPGSSSAGGVSFGAGSSTTLVYADAAAIAANDPNVAQVAPLVQKNAQIVYGSNNTSTSVQGTSANYPLVKPTPVESGRFFLPQEVATSAQVAVLGSQTAQTLFGYQSPVGQTIDINGIPFRVIGVLASEGSNGFQNLDDRVMIPVTTAMNDFTGTDVLSSIDVSASSQTTMNQAQQEVQATLRNLHHLGPGQADDFTIMNQATILSALQSVSQEMTDLLTGVAAISLLVGGIGIMNIMLVSVTERTREIGIRKAIGAKRRVIMTQFLVESVVLSVGGGLIGVALGGGGAEVAGIIMKESNLVSPVAVMLSVSFAVLIGVLFGVYPARKASLLNPIEALRYE